MNKETGGPAFPGQWVHGGGQVESWTGMDLRDYFAAKAMAAIISKWPAYKNNEKDELFAAVSCGAYAYADAMLEARK